MKPVLRPYQQQAEAEIYSHWQQGSINVLSVLPTGAGKTVLFSKIMHDHPGASVAIAHRQELVTQVSLSLGRFGVRHRIIAPKNVINTIISEHRLEFGEVFYDPQAPAAVAGVDTLKSRADSLKQWCRQVTLWVCDEGHHNLSTNKWGFASSLFPNARGLGVTATPRRADGKGLGVHADGVFSSLTIGPSMRDLIDLGALTDYQIVCPPSDFKVEDIKVTATGDFSKKGMTEASQHSHIVGDVVENYIKFAAGKKGITFTTDVETAYHMAQQYRDAGIAAQAVCAKTADNVRNDYIRRFRNGNLMQLVNVDLFGEGFDLPALEVVSMARPTQSLGVYMQQFGRALRPMKGKDRAIVIDHVGNVKRHNLPDIPRVWTLAARSKRGRSSIDPDAIPLTTCLKCFHPYERVKTACPYCGNVPVPQGRASPEMVDGDLTLLDVDILNKMREAANAIDEPPASVGDRAAHATGNPVIGKGVANKHREKQAAQTELRNEIAQWAGVQRAEGRPDAESYKLFYLIYGIDVLSAQSLNRADADRLRERISDR